MQESVVYSEESEDGTVFLFAKVRVGANTFPVMLKKVSKEEWNIAVQKLARMQSVSGVTVGYIE